ncbi:MAG TPA: hypothetical protein VFT79_10825 [Solirubrobacterales bacterium]|nr:hypothetical protein [Solirubrobacterales bacterium]
MTTLTAEADSLATLVAAGSGNGTQIIDQSLRLIETLVEEPTAYAKIHPLGFLQVNLSRYEDFLLRLHLWPVPRIAPRPPVWRVHRHGWDLRSYVLCGAATNLEYDVLPDPAGGSRVYDVSYDADASTLRRTDRLVKCVQRSEVTYEAPAVYDVPPESFHTTISEAAAPTATMVVVGTNKLSQPLVIGDADGDDSYTLTRDRIAGESLRRALRQFL